MSNVIRDPKRDNPIFFWQKVALSVRLGAIGLALFLIMIGTLSLMPEEMVPGGTGLIGTGLILMGICLARYFYGIWPDIIALILGITMLASGIGEVFFSVHLFIPILLLTIGSTIVIKSILVNEVVSNNTLSETMAWCFELKEDGI